MVLLSNKQNNNYSNNTCTQQLWCKKQNSSGSCIKNASARHGFQCSYGIRDEGNFKDIASCLSYLKGKCSKTLLSRLEESFAGFGIHFPPYKCNLIVSLFLVISEDKYIDFCSLIPPFMLRSLHHIAKLNIPSCRFSYTVSIM